MNEFDGQKPAWLDAARQTLDDSAARLDGATLARLNQARQRALAAPRRRPWLPLGLLGGATAAALAVLVWSWQPAGDAAELIDDFDMLAGEVDLEFYRQLEFIAWLDGHAG